MIKKYLVKNLKSNRFVTSTLTEHSTPNHSCFFDKKDATTFIGSAESCADVDGIFQIIEVYTIKSSTQFFTFGKYEGRSFGEIAKIDPGYFIWLKENTNKIEGELTDFFNSNCELINNRVKQKFRKYLQEECSDYDLDEEDFL